MTFRIKTLLWYQEPFLDIEEHRKKSYEQGYDLLVLRGRDGSITVVTPEGAGQVIALADEGELEAFVLRRSETFLLPVEPATDQPPFLSWHPVYVMAVDFLAFTRDAGVFHGTSGNLSLRANLQGDLIVSPTGVCKADLRASQMVCVRNEGEGRLPYYGPNRPSIDTPVQAAVYRNYTGIVALLHVHADTVAVEDPIRTSFPYPCGTYQEVVEVCSALRDSGRNANEGFCLELAHHGYLIGFTLRQFLVLPYRIRSFDPPTGVFTPGFSGFRRRVVFGHGDLLHVLVS